MPGAVYCGRLFSTSLGVCVCICLYVWTQGCIGSAYFTLWMCLHERTCVQMCAFSFMFRYTWADGCWCVLQNPRMCRALVLCSQAKSSCCGSGVSRLCHDTKLIFYQLSFLFGKRRDKGAGWGLRGCVKEDRKHPASVNNPGLWRKFKKPNTVLCYPWRTQFPLHIPCHPWPDRTLCRDGLASVCQCRQVSMCQCPSPVLQQPSTLLMDTHLLHWYATGGILNGFWFQWVSKCQLLWLQAKLDEWNYIFSTNFWPS